MNVSTDYILAYRQMVRVVISPVQGSPGRIPLHVFLAFYVLIVLNTELHWFWQSGYVIDGSENDGSSAELRRESGLIVSEALQVEHCRAVGHWQRYVYV